MSIMDRSSFRLDDIEKTWIFDLDGTLVVHNGYKNGVDELLPGVKKFYEKNIDCLLYTSPSPRDRQ